MNRKEIKELAKQKIKGNIWNLLWPLLVIGVLESIVSSIFGGSQTALVNVDLQTLDLNALKEATNVSPINYLITLVFSILNISYIKYALTFVRTGKCDFNDIIDCVKAKWLNILIVTLLTGLLIGLGYVLFVIPGIILTLGLSMASVIVVDSDLGPLDAIKASWNMMKGYKWNYLIFCLSFLGWILLSPFTLFLLFIWLIPYMTVAELIYYDKLKKIKDI